MTKPKNRILMLAASLALAAMPVAAQSTQGWVPYTGVKQVGHGVTEPVRSMPKASPHAGPPVQVPLLHRPSFVPSPQKPAAPDTALQTTQGPRLNAVAEPGFGGVGFNGYYPPDPNSSVGGKDSTGHEEVVETTNVEFSVYDAATGQVLSGPTSIDSLFSSLSGTLCASSNGGDPIVLWDKIAHRWLISQLAYTNNLRNDEACIAISQTADATGSYNAYGFSFSNLTDYPKYGVWSSSSSNGTSDYYFSANLFSTAKYYGPVVCAFNGADMQSGKAAEYACSQGSSSNFSLLPSDSDGATPPGTGEPNYFVELGNSSSLTMYPFLATWTGTGTGGTLNNPTAITMNVDPYTEACSGGGQCIPQPGTNETLDSLGDRLMYRLAFRKSSLGESLVVNNAVDEGNGVVGIRWYEFTTPNTFDSYETGKNPTFSGTTDQGTFGPDSNYRWMGSIAQDGNGDIALGYSESNGTNLYPSIYYTGTTSPSSETLDTENPILIGGGAETGSYRWGDYSSMSVDPADDCTFWYTNEYFNANASSVAWSTYIAPFNFDSCPTFDMSFPSTTNSATVSAGNPAPYTINVAAGTGFSGTIGLTAENPSKGLSASDVSFSGNSVTNNSVSLSGGATQTVTVTVNTPSTMAAGTYTFDVVGEDASVTNGAGGALAKGLPLTLIVTSGSGGGGSNVTVSKVTFSPNPVTGGTSTTGTVTLSGPVSSSVSVLLSSNSSYASVPGSVTVSANHSSAAFTVTTTAPSSNTSANITASYNNSSATGTLQISAPTSSVTVSKVTFNPNAVTGGTSTTGTVTLSGTVSSSVSVGLSSNSSYATVPGSVTVSANQSSATFTVTTTAPSSNTSANITASYNNSSATGTLQISAPSTGGFAVSATPSSQSITPSQNPTYTVTVKSSGFSGSVSLSVSGLQKFMNGTFSTNPVTVSANGSATSTLTVRTNKNVAPSTGLGYPLTITGTSGSQTSTYTVYLVVQ